LGLGLIYDFGFRPDLIGNRETSFDVKGHLSATLILSSLILSGPICKAEGLEPAPYSDGESAALIMPGCRRSTEPGNNSGAFEQGVCIGLLKGLYYLSSGACIPPGVTISAMARIVVRYIDDRPSRLHEDFRELALEAFRTGWPCSGTSNIRFDLPK
jgi:hypothetical protein